MKRQSLARFGLALTLAASTLLATATSASAAVPDDFPGTSISLSSGLYTSTNQTNIGSTTAVGEYDTFTSNTKGDETNWYSLVLSQAGTLEVSACATSNVNNANSKQYLNIYKGLSALPTTNAALVAATPAACATGLGEKYSISATAGTFYFQTAVQQGAGDPGVFTLSASFTAAPPVVPLSRVTICH